MLIPYFFTIDKFKEAYALEISPIPDKDQWAPIDTSEKIYPPIIKRPVGRPKKNRIVPHDETKKRRKCRRCGRYGHLQKTCKRSPSDAGTSQVSPSDASTSQVPPSEPWDE
ncbi:zinc finger, SWIM-type containing protein [Tanacetum coccineum]